MVFMYLVEVLALNEDVKYDFRGRVLAEGYGRQNNLLTCAHLIAVLLDRLPLVDFAGGMARPPTGLSPITQSGARAAFPMLTVSVFG